jgi:hypothetical protein
MVFITIGDNGWKDIIIIGLMYLATLATMVTMGVIEIVYQINMYLVRKRIARWRVENPEKIRILQYVCSTTCSILNNKSYYTIIFIIASTGFFLLFSS